MTPGLIIAAPHSGCGKTIITLGLLRLFAREGLAVRAAKIGPDYIDPAFHDAALGGGFCLNLDPWAMRRQTLQQLTALLGADGDLILVEGVMGLFDGARDGSGSTADLAQHTGWPVVLVADGRGAGVSVGATVLGFHRFREDTGISGVIVNRVGGSVHGAMVRDGCRRAGVPLLGMIPRDDALALPSRHLGLVQAREHPALEQLLEHAADVMAAHLDAPRLRALARAAAPRAAPRAAAPIPPPGQNIAVARDAAFGFAYPVWFQAWREAGAEVSFFSPLADEPPRLRADAVFLPGGYPELFAGRIAAAGAFLEGLRAAARRGAVIYGECGGYMTLGRGLRDADGKRHAMAGLLPVDTHFAPAARVLGYRTATLAGDSPLGPRGAAFRAHEFHAARAASGSSPAPAPLFQVHDGDARLPCGVRNGSVMGSFLHLVDGALSEPG